MTPLGTTSATDNIPPRVIAKAPGTEKSATPARLLLEPTLRDLRAELERRTPSSNATGVDAMSREALLAPGKLLRPVLFVEAAAAAGMPRRDTIPAALSVECLHTGSLVHDDVIDGDALRRGRPTVVARHGTGNAIVTGDALIMETFQTIVALAGGIVPSDRLLAVVGALASAGTDLCRGQVREEELRANPDCSLDSYLDMVSLKTGALFRGACLGGMLLAGATHEEQAAVHRYADHLGLAFQMSDDLLPHLSDTITSGKSALSDLANRRMTFPLLLCRQTASAHDRRRLINAVINETQPDAALETVHELLVATGALEQAKSQAHAQATLAKTALADLQPGNARDVLEAIADLAIDRAR
ncbi:polyprenyl synthetase family protein [Streptomyces lydicus]|uniref:polyprenyl synthetase family protein n=1 Tax=Streptomyces lydicus TaxID=47763 RepID=UPI0033D8E75B